MAAIGGSDVRESTDVEVWKPVPGYEGFYEVSNMGRVRSLPRVVEDKLGRRRPVPGCMLKLTPRQPGNQAGNISYLAVGLCRNGTTKSVTVHRLVVLAFLGEPKPGQVVRHLDGDHRNNKLSNLVWGTPVENAQDAMRHGTHPALAQMSKAHCTKGHEFTAENTRICASNGQRVCKTCDREKALAWYYRNHEKAKAANRERARKARLKYIGKKSA